MTTPPIDERFQFAKPDKEGTPTFQWNLTGTSLTDTVKLVAGPFNVLPVVFVPGIMGSNLKSTPGGEPLWRLDTTAGSPVGLLKSLATKDAGARQALLHPDRTTIDDRGGTPSKLAGSVSDVKTYKERGWGTIGEGTYHSFLLWLEQELNPAQRNPALWQEYYQAEATISAPPQPGAQPKLFPGVRMGIEGQPFNAERHDFSPIMTDDLIARSKMLQPVYAVGYNWLASNKAAAKDLKDRILAIIAENNKGVFRCQQVVLLTHSMGGLVARACVQLPDMATKIAGVVHGVMPAVGAAVAYRRCKLGLWEENKLVSAVIGTNGREVTAVFAQAPGALQLLPSQRYHSGWLRVSESNGQPALKLPAAGVGGLCDPYGEIYAVRDKWWGLVKEEWLSPKGGRPIKWVDYLQALAQAQSFHEGLKDVYHANTYSFYGADPGKASFENMIWKIARGLAPDAKTPPTVAKVLSMGNSEIRSDGTNPAYVGGSLQVTADPVSGTVSSYQTSYWELTGEMQNGGAGDGTVPASSGAAPLVRGGASIRQQFKLMGIEHEPAYQNHTAQRAVLYAITKIAGSAKKPA